MSSDADVKWSATKPDNPVYFSNRTGDSDINIACRYSYVPFRTQCRRAAVCAVRLVAGHIGVHGCVHTHAFW